MSIKYKLLDYCLNVQPENQNWEWQKTKKQYRWKVFPKVTLCIDPRFLFNSHRGVLQPTVRVLYKPYQQLYKKLGFPNKFDYCWNFLIAAYFPKVYSDTTIWDQLPLDPHARWRSFDQAPFLIKEMLQYGETIFRNELDFSDETALVESMILEANDPKVDDRIYFRNIKLHNQAILHLTRGNADYLNQMEERINSGGAAVNRNYIEIIKKRIKEDGLETLLSGIK